MISQNRRRGAFTLVEMLLVLVILAVLAAIVIPKMAGQGQRAKVTAAGTDISMYEAALDRYEVDMGNYPSSLDALVNSPSNAGNKWQGPYVKEIKNDPWGNAYTYKLSGGSYEIMSMGPDGRAGGDDDILNTGGGKR